LVIAIIRKDWRDLRRIIALGVAAMFAPIVALRVGAARPEIAWAMVHGVIAAAPFLYAHFCVAIERQHKALEFVLSLPITPAQFVFAKYASLFSMTLFTVSAPGLLLGDLKFLFYANSAALFFAAIFMAPAVVSDKTWAAQIPFFFVLLLRIVLFPMNWVQSHPAVYAILALALTGLTVLYSAYFFSVKSV
jgi:ABC-type Na+ efflux pump permease subunit